MNRIGRGSSGAFLALFFVLATFITPFSTRADRVRLSRNETFEDFRERRQEEFETYRTERERQFEQFLEERWQEMKVFAGRREDTVPKPAVFPSADESDTAVTRELSIKRVVRKSGASTATEPAGSGTRHPPGDGQADRTVGETTPDNPSNQFSVTFLGRSEQIPQATVLEDLQLDEVSPEGFSRFWSALSGKHTVPLLERLGSIRDRRNLDDWSYLRLVRTLTKQLYDDERLSTVATWAIMLKSGYETRLGYRDNRPYLLLRTKTTLYEVPYFELEGRRFFVYRSGGSDGDLKSIRTYRKDFPGQLNPLIISLDPPPNMPRETHRRSLSFSYRGKTHEFTVTFDKNVVTYLSSLPQLPLERYFRSIRTSGAVDDLIEKLNRELRGVEPDNRVGFLLRFVQTAFEYKTDRDQFGSENFLLPVETLYYPYSDCEDRALLFANLVQRLLDRDAVGLDYPGHVATAVRSEEPLDGFFLRIDETPFLVADPTYINAEPGMVMPEYKNKSPRVIVTAVSARIALANLIPGSVDR